MATKIKMDIRKILKLDDKKLLILARRETNDFISTLEKDIYDAPLYYKYYRKYIYMLINYYFKFKNYLDISTSTSSDSPGLILFGINASIYCFDDGEDLYFYSLMITIKATLFDHTYKKGNLKEIDNILTRLRKASRITNFDKRLEFLFREYMKTFETFLKLTYKHFKKKYFLLIYLTEILDLVRKTLFEAEFLYLLEPEIW